MEKENIQSKVDFILNNIDKHRKVINTAYEIKEHLINLTLKKEISENTLYKITGLLTPQARSPLWQNYFIKKHQCTKVSSEQNKGDFKKDNKHYEYKASGFNQDGSLHIVQIRLWQKCDYIIQSISHEHIYTFLVSHRDMQNEVDLCRASSAHGTKEANKENTNIELRVTVTRGSDNWKRWYNQYLVDDDKVFN